MPIFRNFYLSGFQPLPLQQQRWKCITIVKVMTVALLDRHQYPVCPGKNGNGEFFKVYKFLKVNPIS